MSKIGAGNMLKIGIIGLGDISAIHLNTIEANSNVALVAACDIDNAMQTKVPNAQFFTNFENMLKEVDLDCVHICLPHHLHVSATTACVERGIHVLQEKPLSINAKEGLKLIQLEQKYPDTKICVCFQNRFNETFQTLKQIVQSKKFGEIIGIKGIVTWFRPESYYTDKPWRGKLDTAGGGVLINQAIHTLDLMQLLCGPVDTIKGNVSQLLDYQIEVEDTASAHINFKNGANGMFFATNANFGNSSIELQVIFENEKFTIKDNILTRVNKEGYKIHIIEDKKLPGTKSYYGPSHGTLINQFYDSIYNHTKNYIHVKDALPSIAIIDAIQKSSQTNETIHFTSI